MLQLQILTSQKCLLTLFTHTQNTRETCQFTVLISRIVSSKTDLLEPTQNAQTHQNRFVC